jgi:hypothetical protein
MVPDIAKSGHSFKGALAYYLHDKQQEGQAARPQTAERVAWTETRNLATDDPAIAKRVMIATAKQADELKARAGIANTGRKSNAHVYAYSLAWHPDEAGKIDRAEMLRAVDQTLKVLGAEKHQAIIVCHQDQKHPHVHVILNRVDPTTGKMLSTSNDRLKLSDWANVYERERGVILTPKREEKRQMREQFAEKAARKDYAAEKRAEAAQRPTASKSAGAMLKELQEGQKARHSVEWLDLANANKGARDQIYTAYGDRMKKAAALHKAECKPLWAAYFRDERRKRREFERREKSLSGVIVNAMMATTQQKISGQLGNRGVLSATFGNALSSQARAAAFAASEGVGRGEMQRQLKAVLDAEMSALKDRRGAALTKQRQQFEQARGDLIERQAGEKAKMREAWRQHYERLPADRARKPYWKAPEKPAPTSREKPVKQDFEKARMTPPEVRKAPTTPEYVSRPAPAPSPSGEAPQTPARVVQQVPASTLAPAPVQAEKVVVAKKDWGAAAEAPALPAKDWSKPAEPTQDAVQPRKDWSERAANDKGREIKPLPVRDRNRDDGPER